MKKNLIHIALGLLFLSAASCTDEVLVNEYNGLRVSAGITAESRTSFIDDGEWTHTHWVANDQIGLYSDSESNVAYRAASDGAYSEFTSSGINSITPEEGKKVKAYYPYSDKAQGNNIPLPYTIATSSAKPAAAFLYSEATIENNALNFKFKHVYSYLKITISSKQFRNSLPSGCTLENGGIYLLSDNPISVYDATFNIKTQEITHNKTDNGRMFFYLDDMNVNADETRTYLIPILPQPGNTSVNLYMFYPQTNNSGRVSLVALAGKNTPSEGFQAGCVYELNLAGSGEVSQAEALKDFYQSTQGAQWENNTNWLSTKPYEEWYGLNRSVRGLDYVQTMELGYNNLVDTIPESFAEIMNTASYIDISMNRLTGKIPDAVKNHHKWSTFGWLVTPQHQHLGGGLDLTNSNLYMPATQTTNLIDNSNSTLKDIFSQNKLTQIICLQNPSDVSVVMNQFSASRVNKHLDYASKGFATVIFTNGTNSQLAEGIQEKYGNLEGVYWMTGLPKATVYYNTTYVFDTNGQLVHIARYDNMYDNTQIDQAYTKFLQSVFGDPVKHNAFSFDIYTSTDYSKDGEVFTIQKATAGKGIDLVFLGEGFVDTDMASGGKYETKMKEAANKMFELEPYKSFRNRFNLYGVKVVSPTAEFTEGAAKRINEDYGTCFQYAEKYDPNLPANARMMVIVVYNSENSVGRSYCGMYSNGDFVTFVMDGINNTLIHEACGHGIAKLADEYVEGGYENVTIPQEEKNTLDAYHAMEWGWFGNVDYRGTKSTVRWSHFLNDSRYANDYIGIYEGAYTYGKGTYRSSENSMMNQNIMWFNAPSRELIYKAIMTLSEGPAWKYKYEDFVTYDAINRNSTGGRSAVEPLSRKEQMEILEKHRKPVFMKGSLRDAAQRSSNSKIIVPLR